MVTSSFPNFGSTPNYLTENLPSKRRLLYGNINPNIYHQIPCNTARYKNSFFPDSIKAWNTSRYKNSFFPDSIKAWNNLGASFHSCTSLSNFKNQICALIRPNIKLSFNIHDRQGLKYISQLRVGLSLLNSHKKA